MWVDFHHINLDKEMSIINNKFVSYEMGVHSSALLFRDSQIKALEAEMQFLKEEIKPIKGYEELYLISNYGYGISLAKEWISGKNNHIHKKKKETVLKANINTGGYLTVCLNKNKKRKAITLHTLVYDHFGIGERNGQILQIDHKDEDKLNCRIDNLQLLSQRQNTAKYFKTQKTSSKYTGVCWHKNRQKWRVHITINSECKHLGYFTNEFEAYNEYDRALKEFNETGKITINTPGMRKKSSKYKNVCWHKVAQKWQAKITINKKIKHLGLFTDEYEAHLVREEAANNL